MKNILRLIFVIVIVLAIIMAARNVTAPRDTLNILIWENYMADDTVSDFEEETGVSVNVETYNSNEELLEILEEHPGIYDVAVPSDYMVQILRDRSMLTPIDKSSIPNLSHIAPTARSHYYDPENTYSVPYAFGSTGFGVNTTFVKDATLTWKELADPRFKGRIVIMDDLRYVLGSVLLELGIDPNTRSAADIRKATDLLITVIPNVQNLSLESQVDRMIDEDVWIAFDYSGDVYQMQTGNPAITYMIPGSGSMQFFDALVVPAGAPHKETAMKFIDYIHRPQVTAAITNATHYGTPNAAALPHVAEELRANPAIFPSMASMQKLHFVRDVGNESGLYDAGWQEIRDLYESALPTIPPFFDERPEIHL